MQRSVLAPSRDFVRRDGAGSERGTTAALELMLNVGVSGRRDVWTSGRSQYPGRRAALTLPVSWRVADRRQTHRRSLDAMTTTIDVEPVHAFWMRYARSATAPPISTSSSTSCAVTCAIVPSATPAIWRKIWWTTRCDGPKRSKPARGCSMRSAWRQRRTARRSRRPHRAHGRSHAARSRTLRMSSTSRRSVFRRPNARPCPTVPRGHRHPRTVIAAPSWPALNSRLIGGSPNAVFSGACAQLCGARF